MKEIMDWIKELPAEYIILFVLMIIGIILVVSVMVSVGKIKSKVYGEKLFLSEDLIFENDNYHSRLKITNTNYSMLIIREIGIIHAKVKHPIMIETLTLDGRNHHTENVAISKLRSIVKSSKKSKLYFYIIDSINRVQTKKIKLTNKLINKQVSDEKRALKHADKTARIASGNYNLGDRIVYILKVIASPFVKLYCWLSGKINKSMHKKKSKFTETKQPKNEPKVESLIEQNEAVITEEIGSEVCDIVEDDEENTDIEIEDN